MSLHALLAARAHAQGRAQPTALYRHRAFGADPLCIVAWQVGVEPYSVGSIAIGRRKSGYSLFVPGYPLDRELLFQALLGFAREFCGAFEAWARGAVRCIEHRGSDLAIPDDLPQIVVANAATIHLLSRLGRRLAYLPTDGEHAADPLLPRLGRHLQWITEYAALPGQQLIVSATDLLASRYVTAMSMLETQSLAALDAWIDPPAGTHGFEAAEEAEAVVVGPMPSPEDGKRVFELMKTFNEQRGRSRDPAVVAKFIEPLRRHYDELTARTWHLIWKVIDRERATSEAASVARRAEEDRIAYATHVQWMDGPAEGRHKTRMTPRQAAMRLNELERARSLCLAEEAIDDPLCMAPHLLAGKAIAGKVVDCDTQRRERINGRNCLRPSVTIRTDEPCLMTPGAELWWTESPAGKEWRVSTVTPQGEGACVTLVLQTNQIRKLTFPVVGRRACFSQFNTKAGYQLILPNRTPWTHAPARPPTERDLDYEGAGGRAA